jgi:hypothetical protein
MNNWLSDFLVRLWEISLKPQAFFVTLLIYIPIKMGGSEPKITFEEIYRGTLEDYFNDSGYQD